MQSGSKYMIVMDLSNKDLLMLEPFYGGSHKQLIDGICHHFSYVGFQSFDLVTLPAKKWHWKARCSALQFFHTIPKEMKYKTLFCSSVLNLAELVGIRSDLSSCHKVVYFHENQLVYPVQKQEIYDFQFGYNQILTALAADILLFNSKYNLDSFLNNINRFLKTIPSYKAEDLSSVISPKCRVLYFPMNFRSLNSSTKKISSPKSDQQTLHIVWAHRWEHDKNPDSFFKVLSDLKKNGHAFHVSVLGEQYSEIPSVFESTKELLGDSILNWGYATSREEYIAIIRSADVAVSTANHEFFGVAMMECAYCGSFPLCPNRLSYPELYPKECLYNTDNQLYKRLKEYCLKPWLPAEHYKKLHINFEAYSMDSLQKDYLGILGII